MAPRINPVTEKGNQPADRTVSSGASQGDEKKEPPPPPPPKIVLRPDVLIHEVDHEGIERF
jgi:hypothetical protein